MKIKIEEAKRKDIKSIVKLNMGFVYFHREIDKYYQLSKDFQKKFERHLTKILRKRNFKILIARDKDKVIAYFLGRIIKPYELYAAQERIGEITDAFVLEKYRNKGIGKQILNKLIKWFTANKIKYIVATPDARNKIGVAFWKKCGFFEFQKTMRLDL